MFDVTTAFTQVLTWKKKKDSPIVIEIFGQMRWLTHDCKQGFMVEISPITE